MPLKLQGCLQTGFFKTLYAAEYIVNCVIVVTQDTIMQVQQTS